MRIAIDATPAASQRAGVGRYARELIAELVALPDDDHYLLASAAAPEQNRRLLDALPPGQYRELRRLPLSERYLTAAWQRLRIPVAVERLIGRFDVFHGADFVLPPSRMPRVVTIHDLSFLVAPEFAEPSLASYLRTSVPRALQAASQVITVSASVAAEVTEAYPWARERIVAIPSGVRTPAAVQRRRSSRPVVLTVGTIEPRKNLLNLLNAMRVVRAAHPDALLIVAGRIGWQADAIVARIRDAERAGMARFIEAPGDDTLDELYTEAAVFVYPSFYEGFGLPVLEAMARGVPVVTSAIPALQETGGDAAAYADPHDPESIADAISRFLDDAARRCEYAERGKQRANSFTWRETARRTRRVYRRAVEGSR